MTYISRSASLVRVFYLALVEAWNDNVPRLGASLAYYTLFAIAPILLVATAIAGMVFGAEAARGQLVGQIQGLVGRDGGLAVQALVEGASRRNDGNLATIVGLITVVLASTGAFLELQTAFDAIWRVTPKAHVNIVSFLKDRLRSFGLVVAIGFLLLVSLAVSAALAGISERVGRYAPDLPVVWTVVNISVSLLVTTVLFGLLYRFVPDVELRWNDVATGAFVTAVLFTIGKHLIGLYLGQSAVASSYGAAGSVILLLLWVYYSSQLVLVGAEFTRLHSQQRGVKPPPQDFAKRDAHPHAA
jgi:membrane protein